MIGIGGTGVSGGDAEEFDAVVCVLDAQRIGAEGDAQILRSASAAGKQLFVACNKSEQLQGESLSLSLSLSTLFLSLPPPPPPAFSPLL